MKIGLYFGSFNPIHIGHLIIANTVANNSDIQQIWFVVSPQNPLKKSGSLLNEYHRLHLVQIAIADNPKFKAIDVEFRLPKPSYTVDTLTYFNEKYPSYNFTIIMGSDSYTNLPRWKNFQQIKNRYNIFVYERPPFKMAEVGPQVTILKAPLLEISSTEIRSLVKAGKSIKYMTPEAVNEEILKNNYYK
jgi:nicotinate-nucleotide adenylyltransferase